jgi:hypothetical protein
MTAPDLATETALSLGAAARRLPPLRGNRPINPATVLRWILSGIRGPGGGRVRLEAVRLGGRWVTTVEALERFTATLSAVPCAEAAAAPRTPGQRRRASERAAAELEKLGI